MTEDIRNSAVAGTFYPSNPDKLRHMVESFIRNASPKKPEGRLRAIVVPHAGYIYSGTIAGFGYKLLKEAGFSEPEIVLLGPAHTFAFEGAAIPKSNMWITPLGKVYISGRISELEGHLVRKINEAHVHEHCLEVHLPFLQIIYKKFSIIPIIAGEISPKSLADVLDSFLNDNNPIIVSSDLSHYLSYDDAIEIDSIANKSIPTLNFFQVENEVEACGKIPIIALMHIAKKRNWKGSFIVYRNSGDVTGDKSQVVGYACYAFYE